MVNCQPHALAALSQGKTPNTHWLEGWVGLRFGVNVLGKKNLLPCQDLNFGLSTHSILTVLTALCRLLLVPDFIYSLLPVTGKLTNTVGITWCANLCHLALSCCSDPFSVYKFFSYAVAAFIWRSEPSHTDWGFQNWEGSVTLPTPVLENFCNSTPWVCCSIIMYDGIFNWSGTLSPNCRHRKYCRMTGNIAYSQWPCWNLHFHGDCGRYLLEECCCVPVCLFLPTFHWLNLSDLICSMCNKTVPDW